VSGGLVDTDRLPVHLDHVHDFDGVVRVLFRQELNETVALVHEGNSVLWHVNINHRSGLNEKLPYQGLVHFLVKTTNVDGSVLIPLRYRSRRHAGLIHLNAKKVRGRRCPVCFLDKPFQGLVSSPGRSVLVAVVRVALALLASKVLF